VAFRGWRVEALEFFEGLEADNSKAYWQRNKAAYETEVLGPMQELLAELEPEWGEGKIFRPYRDIRFSADKSPYKTQIAATVGDGYVHLNADALGAGCGTYHMAPDQLERFRAAVAEQRFGGKLETIVADVRAAGIEVTAHETLKTAPKGYPKDHPRVDLLRHKGLITWREWPAGPWLSTRKAKDRIVEVLERSKPLTRWIDAHVGPSTMPERSRR
jgi:uncharacterized protein (TIGR02453 family)